VDKLTDLTIHQGGEPDEKMARLSMVKLEYIYYITDAKRAIIDEKVKNKPALKALIYEVQAPSRAVIKGLVSNIEYYGSTKRMKMKAYFHQIYHFAIHNQYKEARELLLKTHASDFIAQQNQQTQILYNRAVTQIGLAAFRLGLIEETQDSLSEIAQNMRIKEALGQGVSTHNNIEKTYEQEKEELKRKVPFHM
jgi:translation initiation factor 3 subunit C